MVTAPIDQSTTERDTAGIVGPVEPSRARSARDEEPRSHDEDSGEPRGPASRQRSWWWRYGFPVALCVLVLLIPALVYAGSRVVLGSSSGRAVATVTDPQAPGWQAVVDPTPTFVVVSVDEQGSLDSMTLLMLTGDGVGGVVQIPSSTVMGVPGIGNIPLSIVYSKAGIDVLQQGLEGILGVGIGDMTVIEPKEWSSLVGPVSPLAVSNPDPVSRLNAFGLQEVVFPKGSIDIPASQVWPYLSTRSPGETDLNLMVRHEAFWRAWFAKVATSSDPEGAVPGEVDSGLGRFVRNLAKGHVEYATLPANRLPVPGTNTEVYEPQPDQVRALVARMIPFPAGPEGKRPRLEVLDGTGHLDHGMQAAIALGAAGGQVDKIGNASSFDVETTRFVYFDEAMRAQVQHLRDALGFGELVHSDELNSSVDATVVLGADASGRVGPITGSTGG